MHETLLTTPKFAVERRHITTPAGRKLERALVVHPGAVTILPVLPNGDIVLIRNYRFACDQTLLELPAGTLEADERPEDCAARELIEETGYRADKIEPLAMFYTSPGVLDERMYAFVATGLTHVGQDLDETEEIEVEIMSPDKIRQQLAGGKLSDGKTIATLGTYFLSKQ